MIEGHAPLWTRQLHAWCCHSWRIIIQITGFKALPYYVLCIIQHPLYSCRAMEGDDILDEKFPNACFSTSRPLECHPGRDQNNRSPLASRTWSWPRPPSSRSWSHRAPLAIFLLISCSLSGTTFINMARVKRTRQ